MHPPLTYTRAGALADNCVFYGDNLEVLRRHVKHETVDLVYLDPPFNSNQNYNVLFREQDGHRASAQIQAFEDTWQWDEAAAALYHEVVEAGGMVSEALQAFRLLLGTKYRYEDGRGTYCLSDLTANGVRAGSSGEAWRGFDPAPLKRHWAVPKGLVDEVAGADAAGMSTSMKLDALDAAGYVYWTAHGKEGGPGFPRYKRYLKDGTPIQDVITDIPPINSQAAERLGYPTQKPEALLDRILECSSNPGDIVLDPFCGCGTTIASAQRLDRRWIGIDITHLAIGLIRARLRDSYGAGIQYRVVGEPVTLDGARKLAAEDRFQFQAWALGLVGARPAQVKKGADRGIDGRLFFHAGTSSGKTSQIIISVKGAHLKADDVRALDGVRNREHAEIGVLVSFEEPTRLMRADAAALGVYDTPWGAYPRIQLLTVAELLEGKQIQYPHVTGGNRTYKRAPKRVKEAMQLTFDA